MEKTKAKRIRRDPDTTRKLILDAAERIMVEESYAALSTRRIAQEIGINAATVHYYYPTTDDLFVSLHGRMTERQVRELETVVAADNPLEALWAYETAWDQSALGVEFLALLSHRKGIAPILSGVTDNARAAHTRIFEKALANSRIDKGIISPAALATITVAIARTIANEERVGITNGHDEVRKFVGWVLDNLLKQQQAD